MRPLVGRAQQMALLCDALEQVRAGRPRVVLIEGPAGIGKSVLLDWCIAQAGDMRVLRASGDEVESGFPLGIIDQLLAGISPLPEALSHLRQRATELDPLAAGAGLIDLLGELQDHGPVALVVDDAHWADSASLHALVFCLRRLRADRVVALLTARPEESSRLPVSLLRLTETVTIGGLEAAELVQLAQTMGAGPLPARAAERLARHTQGNPLLAVALLEEFGTSVILEPGGLERQAPRSFASIVLARMAACSPEGRDLAAAGSVLGMRWPLELATALARPADPLAAIDAAHGAGLVMIERTTAGPIGSFPHPLVRAAIYQELGLSRRSGLHRAAAELVHDPRDALRHRVDAEPAANPELAAEAAQLAERDATAGSWAAAATASLWASRVTGTRPERERFVLDAVVNLMLAGDVVEAKTLLEGCSAFEESASLHFAHGYRAWAAGEFGPAEAELLRAWEMADRAGDHMLAGRAADLLSSLCVYLGRGAEGITWGQRSLQAHPQPPPGANPRTAMLVGYGMSGRAREGLEVAARFDLEGTAREQSDGLVGRGTVRLWSDDPIGARDDLLPIAESCLRRGPLERGMFAAVHLADAEWRLGLWDDALVHAEAAVSAAEDAFHAWFMPEAHAMLAFPLIARGHWDAAETHVRAAVEAAKRIGYGHGTLWAIVARGRLAEARNDPQRVVHVLTPLLSFIAADGVDHPGLHPWRELLGAALITLGRSDEGLSHADVLEHQAKTLDLPSAAARALRLRGLAHLHAGQPDKAALCFKDAMGCLAELPQPFDRALIQADLGAALRRAGHRLDGVSHLEEARDALARLGAGPYLVRLERELSASGLKPAGRSRRFEVRLSPAERSVALLVAQGKTNREVATELVVSAKTVEHHLGRVYHKLGVTSRTQLAVRLAAED